MSKKKTKEEFLTELYEKCSNYRNGEFVVLGEYRKNSVPIIIKNKFGYLKVRPSDILRKCLKFKTNSAIFKDSYFRELLREKSKPFRKGKYQLVTEYIGGKDIIIVKDKYGKLKSTPSDLLAGKTPSIISAIDIKTYVHNILSLNNDDYKSGKFEVIQWYNGRKTPMIFKDKYGLYNVHLHNLIRNCKIWLPSAINLGDNVRNRLIEVRGYEYDYSLLDGIKTVNEEKLKIICKKHGVFEQWYYHHYKEGSGCPKCGKLSAIEILKNNPTGWSHSDWIKSALKSKNFDSFKTYIIRFTDKITGEQFIKIGRTFLTVHLRFAQINMYYDKEVLFLFEDDDPIKVINKELELLRLNKDNNYLPARNFHGKNECFSKVIYD
jgi:hypothetical protein